MRRPDSIFRGTHRALGPVMGLLLMATPTAAQNGSLLFAAPSGSMVSSGPTAIAQLAQPQYQNPEMLEQMGPTAAPPAALDNGIGGTGDPPPVMLNGSSWIYQPAPATRVFRKNDVVTIRVDEITRVAAEGTHQQRKRTLYEAILTDWIRISDWRIKPDPQPEGDPGVAAASRSDYLALSNVESRESMAFNIAATIVDIRPNGNMVLEARKLIRVNDNLWETSLTGICRADDIAPDNVVLSKDLIDLEIIKQDRGHLRDSYRRGWLQRWIDRLGPF